jgi:hypothetical protein
LLTLLDPLLFFTLELGLEISSNDSVTLFGRAVFLYTPGQRIGQRQ